MTKVMLILLGLMGAVISLEMPTETISSLNEMSSLKQATQKKYDQQLMYAAQCQIVIDYMADLKEIADLSCSSEILSSMIAAEEKTQFFENQNEALLHQKECLGQAMDEITAPGLSSADQLAQLYHELWIIIKPQIIESKQDAQILVTFSTAVLARMIESLDAFREDINIPENAF